MTSGAHYEIVRRSLLEKLNYGKVRSRIVTMPDYFLDHSLSCDFDTRALARRMLSLESRGGGEISDVHQSLEVGGNAAICTLALANLGVTVRPIMKTDPLGLSLFRQACGSSKVDLSGVKLTEWSPMMTTILELQRRKGVANIMLGDISRVTPFSFEDLTPQDLRSIDAAEFVGVFNWLYNRKGTELAEKVFAYCHTHSQALTFVDTADVRPRLGDLPEFVRKVLNKGLVDILGLNENEALIVAGVYQPKRKERKDVIAASRIISENSGATVYVHTSDYSVSTSTKGVSRVPAFRVRQLRGTGAGDSWNAGLLVANSLNLAEEESLLFANAVAARYISNLKRAHSSIDNIREFIRSPSCTLKKIH